MTIQELIKVLEVALVMDPLIKDYAVFVHDIPLDGEEPIEVNPFEKTVTLYGE